MIALKFTAFKAPDNPEACERFIIGHRRVLEIYDIKMITSNKSAWMDHRNTYVILVESADGTKVLGGARVQIADEEFPLPIEDAVKLVDPKIVDVVAEHKKGKTGELCGLWNSREIAGFGIGSIYLAWSGVALARILRMQTVFALCAPATVRPGKQVGFTIERSLGSNGYFNYPKLNLVATAMVVEDLDNLTSAMDVVKESVNNLFANPQQTIIFETPKGPVSIEYDFRVRQD